MHPCSGGETVQRAARRAVLNDSYRTDVSLVHPPYVVAIGCMAIAAALTDRNVQPWLEGLACDLNEARACLLLAEESLTSASRRMLGTTGRCASMLQLYFS